MGTNFSISRVSNYCDCCGRADEEEFHIGKRIGIGCGQVAFLVDPDFYNTDDKNAFIAAIQLSLRMGWRLVDERGTRHHDTKVLERIKEWRLSSIGGFS